MLKGRKSDRLFLIAFIGMVLAMAGMILLTPGLVDSASTLHWTSFAVLALIVVGGLFIVRRVRPDRVGQR